MFNTNKGNNNQQDWGVNTRGPQFKNKNGLDPSTLVLGFWNDLVSFKIHPALPKEKQTEEAVFDYEHKLNTAVTLSGLESFIEKIKEEFLPALKEESQCFIGMNVSGNTVFGLDTGVKSTGEVRPFFAIYKDIDEKTFKPGQAIRYEFVKSVVVKDYDPTDGKSEIIKDVHGELRIFIRTLEEAAKALTKAQSHADNVVNRYSKERLEKALFGLAEKNGIQVGFRKPKSVSNGNMFAFNTPKQEDGYTELPDAKMSEVELGDDLPF